MNWQFFAVMAAGMLESAGMAKKMEDADNVGSDDLLGDGLVYAAQFIRWLLSRRTTPAPKVPSSIATFKG